MTVFTIRVVYKSGYTHDFDVTSFSVKDNTWKWEARDAKNMPVVLGTDEIAAVWQIDVREEEDV